MWSTILGLFSGLFNLSLRVLEMLKEQKWVQKGIDIEKARNMELESKQAKSEAELIRQQSEILLSESSKKELVDKMEKGNF